MSALVILSMASCSAQIAKQDDRICVKVVPPDPKDKNPASCIQTYAYQFARAPGPADKIADAVVFGCENTLRNFVKGEKDKEAAYSNLRDLSRNLAEFDIIQARAGNCDIPPRWKD